MSITIENTETTRAIAEQVYGLIRGTSLFRDLEYRGIIEVWNPNNNFDNRLRAIPLGDDDEASRMWIVQWETGAESGYNLCDSEKAKDARVAELLADVFGVSD
jgi:hypothetical protein